MKIAKVQSFLLSYALPEPLNLAYYGGRLTIVKRDAMLIRVEGDSGLIGYAPGPPSERAHDSIGRMIGPFLEGRVLADPDALRIRFQSGPGSDGRVADVYAAVEIALYDLLGKERGLPVSELLSGRLRNHIRLYGSAGMYMPPENYAEEAVAIGGLGFRAYKMRAGGGPEADVETVRRTRQAAGPDFDLMVDAHTWWRMGDRSYGESTVEQVARELANYRIAWLEEPLPPDDHEGYLRLKQLDLVPLACGEHEPSELGHIDLIRMGGVDYVQMDVARQGGYPAGRRLLPGIADRGLSFAFRNEGTALDVIAAAHLGVCWPESVVGWLEYPCYSTPVRAGMYPFPLAAEILREPLQIDHGDLLVPPSPGLGVEVDESVIERYPWIPGPWSQYRLDSPAETWDAGSDRGSKWARKSQSAASNS